MSGYKNRHFLTITNVCSIGAFEAQFNEANRFPCSVNTIVLSGEFWFMGGKEIFKHMKLDVWELNGRKACGS